MRLACFLGLRKAYILSNCIVSHPKSGFSALWAFLPSRTPNSKATPMLKASLNPVLLEDYWRTEHPEDEFELVDV